MLIPVSLLGLWPTLQFYFLQYATRLPKRRRSSCTWTQRCPSVLQEDEAQTTLTGPTLTHQVTLWGWTTPLGNYALLDRVREVSQGLRMLPWKPGVAISELTSQHSFRPHYCSALIFYVQSLWVHVTQLPSSTHSEHTYVITSAEFNYWRPRDWNWASDLFLL